MRIGLTGALSVGEFSYPAGAVLKVGKKNADGTIPKRIADRLLREKFAYPIPGAASSSSDKLVNLGGGWFMLPDGRKVQGADDAAAALAELSRAEGDHL